ncbi:hypothetical protein [Aureispira sp. CCB-E]|uniref:hypothetical protein n=1 Tax=Aureispira sp. CCB-E TaxID=3051121 RepID=UPI002868968F|nr:hypothetical protein [Aureispira sp. CCB-E]WMX15865.1 hypothetical protein QP953_05630 [Aureispira sp. CCB-E]
MKVFKFSLLECFKVRNQIAENILWMLCFALCSTICSFSTIASDTGGNKFAQFQIDDASSAAAYKKIEHYIRAQPEILKVSIDIETGIVFCLFDGNTTVDETSFAHWLTQKHYTLSCYREGVIGVDPILTKEEFECM